MEENVQSSARLILCFFPIALLALRAQTIEVTPAHVLIDETAAVRVRGCQPNERVAIRAELIDGADGQWVSQSEFIADAQGAIDTSRDAAVAGSYKGISSMGPLWSMRPSHAKEGRYLPPRNSSVQQIDFQLLRESAVVATARMEQAAAGEGIERIPLHDGPLRGKLFVPPGNSQHPAGVFRAGIRLDGQTSGDRSSPTRGLGDFARR